MRIFQFILIHCFLTTVLLLVLSTSHIVHFSYCPLETAKQLFIFWYCPLFLLVLSTPLALFSYCPFFGASRLYHYWYCPLDNTRRWTVTQPTSGKHKHKLYSPMLLLLLLLLQTLLLSNMLHKHQDLIPETQ